MEEETKPKRQNWSKKGWCTECGKLERLHDIYESHSADVIARLCDKCYAQHIERMEMLYRGE